MVCVSLCNPNITTSIEFVNEWLNHSSATGLYQLHDHVGTVVNVLLNNASTDVRQPQSIYYTCIHLYYRDDIIANLHMRNSIIIMLIFIGI